MTIETAYSVVSTLGVGFFLSFLMGYFVKKVIKVLMFVLGGILALLMYLQFQEIIDVNIKLDRLQTSAEAIINTVAVSTIAIFPNDNKPSILDTSLGIPVSGSVTAGFMLGVTRRG